MILALQVSKQFLDFAIRGTQCAVLHGKLLCFSRANKHKAILLPQTEQANPFVSAIIEKTNLYKRYSSKKGKDFLRIVRLSE